MAMGRVSGGGVSVQEALTKNVPGTKIGRQTKTCAASAPLICLCFPSPKMIFLGMVEKYDHLWACAHSLRAFYLIWWQAVTK